MEAKIKYMNQIIKSCIIIHIMLVIHILVCLFLHIGSWEELREHVDESTLSRITFLQI